MSSKYLPKSKFISPGTVLSELGLRSGDTVIDYSSGAGHWTLAAAKIIGSSGSVMAIDNDEGMLELIRGRAVLSNYTNVLTETVDLEKKNALEMDPAELVIVANVLYQIHDKKNFVKSATKLVSDTGKLLFVDWAPKRALFGPDAEMRLTEEAVISLFEDAGLKLACTVDAGSHHYGLIFDRKGEGCGWKE